MVYLDIVYTNEQAKGLACNVAKEEDHHVERVMYTPWRKERGCSS